MHTGTRRIGDHHIGPAMLDKEGIRAHISYIASKEGAVLQSVQAGIFLRIDNRISHCLDTYYLSCAPCAKNADAAGAAI